MVASVAFGSFLPEWRGKQRASGKHRYGADLAHRGATFDSGSTVVVTKTRPRLVGREG